MGSKKGNRQQHFWWTFWTVFRSRFILMKCFRIRPNDTEPTGSEKLLFKLGMESSIEHPCHCKIKLNLYYPAPWEKKISLSKSHQQYIFWPKIIYYYFIHSSINAQKLKNYWLNLSARVFSKVYRTVLHNFFK